MLGMTDPYGILGCGVSGEQQLKKLCLYSNRLYQELQPTLGMYLCLSQYCIYSAKTSSKPSATLGITCSIADRPITWNHCSHTCSLKDQYCVNMASLFSFPFSPSVNSVCGVYVFSQCLQSLSEQPTDNQEIPGTCGLSHACRNRRLIISDKLLD